MTTTKIILDTDPGIDDAMALHFAHHCAQIELLGITTVFGNADIQTTTRNALFLADKFGISTPVAQGAATPLMVAPGEIPTFVHGTDGLGNCAPANVNGLPAESPAAQFIVDTVHAHPGAVTLIAIGPLTNLAAALRLDPGIASQVQQVILMGGALGSNEHTGNVTPVAEANIYGDPHAADLVFTASWPVVMVGLDATMTCVMTPARLTRLCAAAGAAGQFLWDITRVYETYYRERRGFSGFPVHDACTIAYAINPLLFQTVQGGVRVITEGISRGHTIMVPADRKFPMGAWAELPQQHACIGAASDDLLDLYESTITTNA